jgi:hypothetical protein
MARETEPTPRADRMTESTKPNEEAKPMIRLDARSATTPYAWIGSLQFPVIEPAIRQPQTPRTDRAEPMRLDRDTARAMVDAGFMPLSRYIQMFEADDDEPSCIAEVEH